MIIKKINHSEVSAEELNAYKEQVSNLNGTWFNASDVGMDKRIISVRLNEGDDLTLVNPVIIEHPNEHIVYFESDGKRTRKVMRYKWIKVSTDNMGVLEFGATRSKWQDIADMMSDVELFECVVIQRLIDSIDGIDMSHPSRKYNIQVVNKKIPGRNQKVLLQSPEGEMVFVKYKKAQPLLEMGYKQVN